MTNIHDLTRDDDADRILRFAAEGRLVQSEWHNSDENGREIACLLGAIHPDIDSSDDCPAEIMPAWMANLLPTLFDGVRAEVAADYGKRFANALRQGNTDDSVLRKTLIAAIKYAVAAAKKVQPMPPFAYWTDVQKACDRVVELSISNSDAADAARAADAAHAACAARAACADGYAAGAAGYVAGAAACADGAADAARAAACAAGAAGYAADAARAAADAARAAAGAAGYAADAADAAGYAAGEHLFDALIAAMLDGVVMP